MVHRIIGIAGAAVMLAAQISAASASAVHVNRPLADHLTRQFNRQELQQLRSSAPDAYSHRFDRQRLAQPASARPRWHYLPR